MFFAAFLAALFSADAKAAEVGILKCRFNGVDAALHFGAKRQLACVFRQKRRKRKDRYLAMVEKYGIEVGIIGSRKMVWRVTAKTGQRLRRGALAGTYRGITTEASVGAGFAANILTGGPGRSYSFHPLAFEKVEGLNVAAGLLVLTLKRAR
ncbi:MAG: DUF992 domain-containing protein [Alphaproteobacteria bacterium]|nr:DUF992 domain-containing protein [Alphaproteobacteria bacterium]